MLALPNALGSSVVTCADGRFSEPSGTFLGVKALVAPDPGGGMPVIETIWRATESTESVIRRINEKLRERDRWNGHGTVNWEQVFRDLHRAMVLSIEYKRRDTTARWQLHGGLYELHGKDWAITEAGIEYCPSGQVVLSETDFPSATDPLRSSRLSDPFVWAPDPPDGAPAEEWRHVQPRQQPTRRREPGLGRRAPPLLERETLCWSTGHSPHRTTRGKARRSPAKTVVPHAGESREQQVVVLLDSEDSARHLQEAGQGHSAVPCRSDTSFAR
jgi:hypothetical protein